VAKGKRKMREGPREERACVRRLRKKKIKKRGGPVCLFDFGQGWGL